MDDLPPSYTNLGFDPERAPDASAPTFHEEPRFEGSFGGSTAQSSEPPPEYEPSQIPLVYDQPNLVFEDVYEACVRYVNQHCCYGKRFLNQMKLLDIINKVVFYYKLESFGEQRGSETKSSPYKSEPIDAATSSLSPDPWQVTALPPDLFKDCKTTLTIPHTDVVRICSICTGIGNIQCDSCNGRGSKACFTCSGTGRDILYSNCKSCNGSGNRMCWYCFGTGSDTCTGCSGYGKIKFWKVLHVKWKNHVEEYFTDAGYLPNELISDANGVELFKKKDLSLEPIKNAPDASINTTSARLLEFHKTAFPGEMIIRQRHVLKVVPLTRVTYNWKQIDGEFYVYDTDRKVYFNDYPQSCCCCTCS